MDAEYLKNKHQYFSGLYLLDSEKFKDYFFIMVYRGNNFSCTHLAQNFGQNNPRNDNF
jgi:hypothetical protein